MFKVILNYIPNETSLGYIGFSVNKNIEKNKIGKKIERRSSTFAAGQSIKEQIWHLSVIGGGGAQVSPSQFTEGLRWAGSCGYSSGS